MSNDTIMESIMSTLDHIDKILNKRCLWVTHTYDSFPTIYWHVIKYEHRKPISENSLYKSEYLSDVAIFLKGYCLAVNDLKVNRT